MHLFKKKNDFATQWHAHNTHNETYPVCWFDMTKVSVGKRSYGPLTVYAPSTGSEKLLIGNYVSIGPDVKFILASEHPFTGISTFPFKVKLNLTKFEAQSKGDIIVDDDVWIGANAIINSGVHIGQGAIIASGAVVVKDVEPYAVVGGNPARLIKYRFPQSIRKQLLNFDFGNLDEQAIVQNVEDFYAPLTTKNISKNLTRFFKKDKL